MAALDTDSQDTHHPPLIITAIGILVVVVAVALNYVVFLPRLSDTPPVAALPAAAVVPATGPAAVRPAFDVVRVSPTGDVVIAGTAGPGATVTVFSSELPIGQVVADVGGEWVFLPEQALPPGTHRLRLEQAAVGDGTAKSGETIVVEVPAPGSKRDAAFKVIYGASRSQSQSGKADLMRRSPGSGVPAGP
jgi:hypothetical protein